MEFGDRPRWQVPRLQRDGRVLGGVAGGIAAELGLDPIVVRVAFVVLAAASGIGIVIYVVAWVVMAENGRRGGDEPYGPEPKGQSEAGRLIGFGLVVLGLMFLARTIGTGFVDSLVWPLAVLGIGVGIALHRGVGLDRLVGDRSTPLLLRAVAGAVLVVTGIILAISLNFDLRAATDTALVVALLLGGLALVFAPWGLRVVRDLGDERRRRIRSEERAEVAAHLHDSVLQTLALIQRRAADPEVVSLARRQERDLRSWLFGEAAVGAAGGFRRRLESLAAELEQLHSVPVEVVVVGDIGAGEEVDSLLAAVGEAVANAAVHAEAARVDVFAEVSPKAIDVFVRDQGIGFEPDQIPADRKGVSESIRGRMHRVGGTATVESAPGVGTEVELHLSLEADPS